MPHPLCAALSDPKVLLSLAPEDLGGVLLPILKELPGRLSGYIFVNEKHLFQGDGSYDFSLKDRVSRAIMEAWSWMITAGLLAPDPGQLPGGDWVFLTRRAEEIHDKAAFEAFRKASALPRSILHPVIADRAWPNFHRGDHDTAVFQAFREVEVAVRDAAGGVDAKLHDMYGTDLMRAAFHQDKGPLTDKSQSKAERELLARLFAGAIGSYKIQVVIALS